MSEGASRGSLLAPYSVTVKKGSENLREDLLWDLKGKQTAIDVSRSICSQHRLSEDRIPGIESQLQRGLRLYRDANSDDPMVSVLVQVPLGGDDLLVDRVMWDLNNPRFNVDMYAAALCRDFKLDWLQYANVVRYMKARIDQCRQDVRQGGKKTTLVAQPKVVKRLKPTPYPTIINLQSLKKKAKSQSKNPGNGAGEQSVSQPSVDGGSAPHYLSPAGPTQQQDAPGIQKQEGEPPGMEEDGKKQATADGDQGAHGADATDHAELVDDKDDSDMPDLDFDE